MPVLSFIITAIITVICFTHPALAQSPVHALAMHGAPKYSADFEHIETVNPTAPQGGDLRIAAIGGFDSFNPYLLKGQPAQGLKYLHDPLMRRVWEEPFSLYGLIAKQVIVPDDRSRITYILDERATFHDGSPITTADVAFTFETLKSHGRPNARRVYKLVEKVEITSPQRITFHLGPGHDRETVMILSLMPVLSKAYWTTREFNKTTLEPPVGSGPYQIARFEPNRDVTYKKAANYWAKDHPVNKGFYNVEQIHYSYFRDENVALQAFLSGEVDLRFEADLTRWREAYTVEDPRFIKAHITHKRPAWFQGFAINTRRAPFDDLNVRQALRLAFDFDWMNRALFYGAQNQVRGPFTNSPLAHNAIKEKETEKAPHLKRRHALKQARDLLNEAGWSVVNGALQKDGEPLTLSILLQDPTHEKIALHFVKSLQTLGITAELRSVDSAQFSRLTSSFDFDLTYGRWINSLSPGTEQAIYWGSVSRNLEGGRNLAGVTDPQIDAAIAKLTTAREYDGLVRAAKTLDKLIYDGAYLIPFGYTPHDMLAHSKDVHLPKTTPLYGAVMESFWVE